MKIVVCLDDVFQKGILWRSDAEKIIWKTVKLVVLLFSDMDVISIKHLATIHKMTRKILENPLTWKNITRTRSSWLNCSLRDDEAVYWVSIGQ